MFKKQYWKLMLLLNQKQTFSVWHIHFVFDNHVSSFSSYFGKLLWNENVCIYQNSKRSLCTFNVYQWLTFHANEQKLCNVLLVFPFSLEFCNIRRKFCLGTSLSKNDWEIFKVQFLRESSVCVLFRLATCFI